MRECIHFFLAISLWRILSLLTEQGKCQRLWRVEKMCSYYTFLGAKPATAVTRTKTPKYGVHASAARLTETYTH